LGAGGQLCTGRLKNVKRVAEILASHATRDLITAGIITSSFAAAIFVLPVKGYIADFYIGN